MKKTGTINISDEGVADEFTRFMKETDPKGHKKIEEIVEITNFDPKGRKKNAIGGLAGHVRRIMHIKDYARAEGWFRKHAAGSFKQRCVESVCCKKQQDPRTTNHGSGWTDRVCYMGVQLHLKA